MQPKYSATHPTGQQALLRPWLLSFPSGGKMPLQKHHSQEVQLSGSSGCRLCLVPGRNTQRLLPRFISCVPAPTTGHAATHLIEKAFNLQMQFVFLQKAYKGGDADLFHALKAIWKRVGFSEVFLGAMESQFTARHCQSQEKAGEIQGFYL